MLFLHFFIILLLSILFSFFFFFNDTATTEIYTLSLHDALPISDEIPRWLKRCDIGVLATRQDTFLDLSFSGKLSERSEEHTSELQSRPHLVCRLLLEKKKKKQPGMLTHER